MYSQLWLLINNASGRHFRPCNNFLANYKMHWSLWMGTMQCITYRHFPTYVIALMLRIQKIFFWTFVHSCRLFIIIIISILFIYYYVDGDDYLIQANGNNDKKKKKKSSPHCQSMIFCSNKNPSNQAKPNEY